MALTNTSNAGSSYISSRPAPAHLAAQDNDKDNIAVVHRVQLGTDASTAPAASALRFPRPENVWLSRDVDRADWKAFATHLFPRRRRSPSPTNVGTTTTTPSTSSDEDEDAAVDESARRQRLNDVVSEWNKGFFEPRGLGIIAQFGDEVVGQAVPEGDATDATVVKASTRANNSKQPSRGFGLKLGNSLLGVALPPHSHGYGLRLGGVLLGVRVDDDEEDDEKDK